MTQIHWTNPVSGEFSTAADWTGGVVPGASDDAILDAAGGAYTVTASTGDTVDSIQTATNATLAIVDGATFTAAKGTGSGSSAGTITIAGATLKASGTFANTGTVMLIGGVIATVRPRPSLTIQKSLILEGGGTISLVTNKGYGVIKGIGNAAVLTNVDNTISGAGLIGNNFSLAISNESDGVINANDSNPDAGMEISNNRPSTNAGLIEATDGGNLLVYGTTIDNSGGMIEAASEGSVIISTATITNGGIFAGADSTVDLEGLDTVTDAALSTAVGGEIDISNFSTVTANGVIANAGLIHLGGSDADTSILMLDNAASLTGGGTIQLQGRTIQGTSGSDVLTNVDNTIAGNGELGNGSLTLTNQAAGVIDASGGTLTLNTGANTILNAGLIEATGVDIAIIDSPISNTGTLEADGGTVTANGWVTGTTGSAVIDGGKLEFDSGFNEKVTFIGGVGVLELAKSTKFHKQITGFSATGGTTLDLGDVGFVSSDEATYSGTKSAGVLTVSDGAHTALINLKGNYIGATFTASSDGHDGVDIVATTPPGAAASRFIAAAAALGGQAGGSMSVAEEAARRSPTMLARPGVREA